MFDFLFKRSANKPLPAPAQATTQALEADRIAASTLVRQTALTQAGQFVGNEAAAADFVLQCEFSDARLKAAHAVQSKALLIRVAQAMRNADRRVAKLMQQRLDALVQQEAAQQKADHCLKEARRLCDVPQLMLNQVVDLDRAWQSVGAVPDASGSEFDSVRALLRERLEAQTALQRAVLHLRGRLQQLRQTVLEAPQQLSPEQVAQTLDALEQEMAQHAAMREAPSLPKHLMSECTQELSDFRQTLASLEKRHIAFAVREQVLTGWETEPVASLNEDVLKRAWHALPALHDGDAGALNARFDVLTDRIAQLRQSKETAVHEGKRISQGSFTDTLAAMEAALENGTLQVAAEHDKALRAIDLKAMRLSDAQTAQLEKARSELSRLQGWAKWGGNISREELLKAAEELPAKELAVSELAKRVGGLRERWKSLDVSAGPAGKELWTRFDAACTTAYAPVAAHYKKMAEERQANLAKAQSIIAEVTQFYVTSNCADDTSTAVDWKAIAGYCARMNQAWQRMGPIDRKEKKVLDADFANAMRRLSEPLTAQQQIEIGQREKMIADATGLSATDRGVLDALRALQERWQERAKSLPLERNDEQALWQRFRNACDAVFAKRKEAAQAADADRQQHLQAKEALCTILEAAADAPQDSITRLLRESRDAWERTGPAPRAVERQIDIRYQSATAALQKRLDAAQRSASAAQFNALHDKLALCHALEQKIAGGQPMEGNELEQLQSGWQALPALSADFERALCMRFDAAVAAIGGADNQYAALLKQNQAVLGQEILRLEILMGIDSPPELSRDRLQLQVEVLQSSLKTGQKPVTLETQLMQLCRLPALTDQLIDRRIDQLIGRLRNDNA